MNFKGQHINRLFTFLAGLIILAHAVVPHHHHPEITHSSEQESNCESPPTHEKSNEKPVSHCHALNILALEKTTNSSLNQSLSDNFSFFLAGIIVNIEIPSVKDVNTPIFGNQTIFLKHLFLSTHLLRGPPDVA